MYKYFLTLLVLFISPYFSFAQKLSGVVLDENSEKPLPLVKIAIEQDTTMTDEYGRFSLSLPNSPPQTMKIYLAKEDYASINRTLRTFEIKSQTPVLFYLRYEPPCKCKKK